MTIANLRVFNQSELLNLLAHCSHLLNEAYQDTLVDEFKFASYESSMACDWIRCELAKEHPNFRLQ